jgi:hypothetical protein
MSATTLYEQLSVPGQAPWLDRNRTEYTADDRETVDNDRMLVDLYAVFGDPVMGDRSDVGRTEITRESPETVDNDRAGLALNSTLNGPPTDLYSALVRPAGSVVGDRGETALTASTETIDWDQPADLPYT